MGKTAEPGAGQPLTAKRGRNLTRLRSGLSHAQHDEIAFFAVIKVERADFTDTADPIECLGGLE